MPLVDATCTNPGRTCALRCSAPPVPGVGSVTVPRIFGKDKVKKGDREETSDTQKEIGEKGKGRSSSNDEAGGQFDGPPPRRRAQSPT